jgi:hypothetical protein
MEQLIQLLLVPVVPRVLLTVVVVVTLDLMGVIPLSLAQDLPPSQRQAVVEVLFTLPQLQLSPVDRAAVQLKDPVVMQARAFLGKVIMVVLNITVLDIHRVVAVALDMPVTAHPHLVPAMVAQALLTRLPHQILVN